MKRKKRLKQRITKPTFSGYSFGMCAGYYYGGIDPCYKPELTAKTPIKKKFKSTYDIK